MKQSEIQSKIDVIVNNLEKLYNFKAKSYEEFIADFRNIDSVLYRLQTSIQALLDIGSYIIASLGLKTPNTNAEVIEVLTERGYMPENRAETYIKMIQFRNRVVHLYNDVDTNTLYDILVNELGDIKELYENLLKIIEKH
jgi:uncharacterized protein YutE (UPF0331/DUF86 family)